MMPRMPSTSGALRRRTGVASTGCGACRVSAWTSAGAAARFASGEGVVADIAKPYRRRAARIYFCCSRRIARARVTRSRSPGTPLRCGMRARSSSAITSARWPASTASTAASRTTDERTATTKAAMLTAAASERGDPGPDLAGRCRVDDQTDPDRDGDGEHDHEADDAQRRCRVGAPRRAAGRPRRDGRRSPRSRPRRRRDWRGRAGRAGSARRSDAPGARSRPRRSGRSRTR